MEINGAVVVVTGAASGLGAGASKWLAGQGATVVGCDVADIPADVTGAGVEARSCDVSDDDAVGAMFAGIASDHGRVDAVINCAGIVRSAPLLGPEGRFPTDLFRRILDVNVTGTFLTMAHGAEWMAKNPPNDEGERGVFVNVASIAAFDRSSCIAYAASKGGVVSMAMTAAHDLSAHGIRVMTIAPGYMDTPMFAGLDPAYVEKLKATLVFPKRLAKMEEFGRLVGSIIGNPYLNATAIRFDAGARL